MKKMLGVFILITALALASFAHAAREHNALLGHLSYEFTPDGQTNFSESIEPGFYRITAFGTPSSVISGEKPLITEIHSWEHYCSADKNGEISFEIDASCGKINLELSEDITKIEASPILRFDFGAFPSKDYISVNANEKYSSDKGYGFASPSDVKNVKASGEGALSDAVEFTRFGTASDNTFNVDLPNGLYKIKVTSGDIQRMSVACEDYYAIMNMTGNECEAEIVLPVTDGQLNILATEGKVDTKFSISELEISKISDNAKKKTSIFVGGDSTVSTYYPTAPQDITSQTQAGWGQMIQNYVTDDYYVINYATGGQFAKGFLTSGQFEAVEHYMQAGDIFVVAFGINDQNYSNEEEFKESMREMVRRVKAKGGVPVVVTAQGRLTDFDLNDGKLYYKPDRWFKTATINMTNEENAAYIDLHNITSAYFTRLGKELTTKLYWIKWDGNQDTLHINFWGARECARLLVEEMVNKRILSEAKTPSYGYSDDISWKIYRDDDDNLIIYNTLTNDEWEAPARKINVIRTLYDKNNILAGVDKETVSVNSSAVIQKKYSDMTENIYFYTDGKLISSVGEESVNYAAPINTAHNLYDNYTAPEAN